MFLDSFLLRAVAMAELNVKNFDLKELVVQSNLLSEAVRHLQKLVDNDGEGCRSAYRGTCHYCGMRPSSEHDSECPYPAAKAFIDKLSATASENETPSHSPC